MDANISYQNDGWLLGIENTGRFPDRTMTTKEWNAYLRQIDEVEEIIQQQIIEEGKQNLAHADEARAMRRELWQEQWDEFTANAKLNMKEVLQSGDSGHELFIQTPSEGEIEEASGRKTPDDRFVPYSEYMQDGVITYNGVVFNCNAQEHSISLGDVSDPRQTLTIPLAGGGVLKVNRDEIANLAKAIGMFSPEDVGAILRAIAQDKQVRANQYTIEEEENQTMENMVDRTGEEEK